MYRVYSCCIVLFFFPPKMLCYALILYLYLRFQTVFKSVLDDLAFLGTRLRGACLAL